MARRRLRLITPEQRKAFRLHRNGAGQRGIEFHFTIQEWCDWWEAKLGLDWLNLRGVTLGKYVMARHGDVGPYAQWNVKCITHSANSREQRPHHFTLTEYEVAAIYQTLKATPKGLRGQLAKQYGVSKWTIKAIQRKKVWSRVTDPLD